MAENKFSPEEIFNKNEEEMSEMEKLMAGILNDVSKEADNLNNSEDSGDSEVIEEPVVEAPAPPKKSASIPDDFGTPKAGMNSFIEEPVFDGDSAGSSGRKEGKSKGNRKSKKAKKGKGKITAIIIILCAIAVIGSILYKALSEDLPNSFPGAANNLSETDVDNADSDNIDPDDPEHTLAPDIIIPTPDLEGDDVKISQPGTITIISDTSSDAPLDVTDIVPHSFQIIIEDLSWTAAQAKCAEMGGHLANIANQEELDKITAMAEEKGIEKLWIGCHRENAALVWENDEQISFYKWGKGEPSGYDAGDKVTEDYVMLWKFNGEWVYNDSRDDPVKDYPDMYSGKIGFVCEMGDDSSNSASSEVDSDGDGIPDSVIIDIKPDIPA